jgi:hypothetical protein
VVQNLLIPEDYLYQTIGTHFDLGRTGEITSIEAYAEAAPDPYQRFPSDPMTTYPVFDTSLNAEGDEISMSGFRPQPPTPGVPGPLEFDPEGKNPFCI